MKVSVVISVYNREVELQRAIKSVLQQSVQDFEILVVDDYSEIDLKKSIDCFNDNRIKYFRLEKKGNANVCRNLGIKHSEGKYIAMLDSDDEWLSQHLEFKLKEIQEKNTDLVFGSIIVDSGNSRSNVISRPLKNGEKMVNYLMSDGMAQTSTYFYTSTSAKDILWDETLARHQDWDFIIRYSKKYKVLASAIFTCLVYWKSGERKLEHFESRKIFIERNANDISQKNYVQYHKDVFKSVRNRNEVAENIKKHYEVEFLKHIQYITLNDFLEVYTDKNTSRFEKLLLRIKFIFKILFA